MKHSIKKTLGIVSVGIGLIGMTLPMSGYAWHRHHGGGRWWRHHGGAVVAATMVGMAVGAIAAGNNATAYNSPPCYYHRYWHPGYYSHYYHDYTPGYYQYRRFCPY